MAAAPAAAQDLVARLLRPQPADRLTTEQVRGRVWLCMSQIIAIRLHHAAAAAVCRCSAAARCCACWPGGYWVCCYDCSWQHRWTEGLFGMSRLLEICAAMPDSARIFAGAVHVQPSTDEVHSSSAAHMQMLQHPWLRADVPAGMLEWQQEYLRNAAAQQGSADFAQRWQARQRQVRAIRDEIASAHSAGT